jgi:hypothetical protein
MGGWRRGQVGIGATGAGGIGISRVIIYCGPDYANASLYDSVAIDDSVVAVQPYAARDRG